MGERSFVTPRLACKILSAAWVRKCLTQKSENLEEWNTQSGGIARGVELPVELPPALHKEPEPEGSHWFRLPLVPALYEGQGVLHWLCSHWFRLFMKVKAHCTGSAPLGVPSQGAGTNGLPMVPALYERPGAFRKLRSHWFRLFMTGKGRSTGSAPTDSGSL